MSREQREKGSPAVQIYPGDYLSDDDIDALPDEDYGRFWRVLLRDWKQNGVPSDHKTLAKWLRLRPQKFAAFWAKVGHLFVERDGRYHWPAFDLQREQQAVRSQQARDAIGARWNKARTTSVIPGAYENDTSVSAPLYSSSSSAVRASSPSSAEADADPLTSHAPEPDARLIENKAAWSVVVDFLGAVRKAGRSTGRWKAEINAWLDGLNLQQAATAEDVRAGLSDFLLNDTSGDLSPAYVRAFVERAIRKRTQPPQISRSNNGTPRTGDLVQVEAQQVFSRIWNLRVTNGPSRFIPADRVRELGAAAWNAYDSIGGADAFLSANATNQSFLMRDFTRAYVAERTTPSPAPSPSTET